MWFIGVEVEQETSASPPNKNSGSTPENGTCDIIKEKAEPIKEMRVNCDLLNSALNY